MVFEQEVLGGIDPRGKKGRSPLVRMNPLHQAAMRLSDLRRSGTRFKTKDLVGLLMCHGARAWRISQPRATVRLRVVSPSGFTAVKIGL